MFRNNSLGVCVGLCCSIYLVCYLKALSHVHIPRRQKDAPLSVRVLLLAGSDHGLYSHNLVRPEYCLNASRHNTTHALTTDRVGCVWYSRDVPTQWYPVLIEKFTDTGRVHAVQVSI